ncbi:MAG: hypothetical protein ACRETZ_19185 [Steroidobacteraceae bacterium]
MRAGIYFNKIKTPQPDTLSPALALVDLYADPQAWHPDPDDLDIPPDQTEEALSGSERLRIPLPEPLRDVPDPHHAMARYELDAGSLALQ